MKSPFLGKKALVGTILSILLVGGATTYLYQHPELLRRPTTVKSPNKKPEWIPPPAQYVKNPDKAPDVTITSRKLSDLPQDILKVPVLNDLLTEDFVFYYQEASTALSIEGSLKRIAFEHDLNLQDHLVKILLNSPAEVGLWKSYNGKLEDVMVILENPIVSETAKILASLKSADTQFSKVENFQNGSWDEPVYKLDYHPSKSIYITFNGGNVIAFTNPSMPLPTKSRLEKWSAQTKEQFGSSPERGFFSRLYEPTPSESKHSIYVSTEYLSFGYQAILHTTPAFRFSYDDKSGWLGNTLTSKRDQDLPFNSADLWTVAPKDASLCLALPLNTQAVNDLLMKSLGPHTAIGKTTLESLDPSIAVCWYSSSKLYTPLFVAKANKALDPVSLNALFHQSLGNLEAGILTDADKEEIIRQKEALRRGEQVSDPVKPKTYEKALPVTEARETGGIIWSREVSSRYGLIEASQSLAADKMRSKKFFKVQLAYWGDHLIFSPDKDLVEKTIQVLDKKYPALADTLSSTGTETGLILFPEKMIDLIQAATLDTLPAQQEAIFRESISRRLFPAMDKLKTSPPSALAWPSTSKASRSQWEAVRWQQLPLK